MKHIFQLTKKLGLGSKLNVFVIGCGGTGARMVESLASMNHALGELGRSQFHVTVFDDDTVSPTNIGRQPFYPIDVGLHKAEVLVGRINMCYGFDWEFSNTRFSANTHEDYNNSPDLIIGCVDTVASRKEIMQFIQQIQAKRYNKESLCYWLDCGNSAKTGQVCLGVSKNMEQREVELFNDPNEGQMQSYLPYIVELFPELLENDYVEDDAPSCSMKEALDKQSLFINRAVASQACAMLWELLKEGVITYSTVFVNLQSGRNNSLAIDAKKWRKMGCKASL